MTEHEIICVGCPMGCRVTISTDSVGEITGICGNACKQGEEYATHEFRFPVRVLTATLLTEGSNRPLLPVRTHIPISKDKLKECAAFVSGIRVRPPLRFGEVVVRDILGTGADLICCESLSRDEG